MCKDYPDPLTCSGLRKGELIHVCLVRTTRTKEALFQDSRKTNLYSDSKKKKKEKIKLDALLGIRVNHAGVMLCLWSFGIRIAMLTKGFAWPTAVAAFLAFGYS